MNILYIGDIMGEVGVEVVKKVLPEIKKEKQVDLVIAQAENVTEGKGISVADFTRLQKIGVDFFTGGNWTLAREEIVGQLNDPNVPIIRPANYPDGTAGLGYKYCSTAKGKVLVVSLLGHIVGRDADKEIDNPLKVIDEILTKEKDVERVATIVNFHGDYSSEKRVIGYYLDGRVSAVIGDHWHVPTADADVLPKGTAHITDVGMCGSLDSSLGVKFESVIPRWRDELQTRNILETTGRRQFNSVLIEVDEINGHSRKIESIQKILTV
jgi:2',3'-cyclic-nucleotide 2'-phosphodiesterase